MPLRDHFRPPVESSHSWDELHGMWPAVIVQQLSPILPEGYIAAPRVRLGAAFEVNVLAYRSSASTHRERPDAGNGGPTALAVAPRVPPAPTLTLETELAGLDEYEVRVYDARHGRRLVAAIEIVSPSNKDRPESRRAFVAKVAALLQQDVSASIVDVVTVRQFNLYAELLELIGERDPMLGAKPPALYAVTVRGRKPARRRPLLKAWFQPLALDQSLPALPIRLNDELAVSLDLEAGYEETCRVLRIA